jgi:hypothetical protein
MRAVHLKWVVLHPDDPSSFLFLLLIVGLFCLTFLARIQNSLQDILRMEPISEYLSIPEHLKEEGFIHLNNTLFLHPGKAGGGFVEQRMEQWRLRFRVCHPLPCHKRLLRFDSLIMSVRDPADRFVSAFNWRALVLCRLENETRSPALRNATDHPDLFCKPNSPVETRKIHETYKSNVNMLAEALCDSGITGDQARAASKRILHARTTLTDWIPSDRVANLTVIVLEPGFDFIQQIDSGLKWAVSQTHGEENAAWLSNNIQNTTMAKEWLHSSSVNDYRPPPLSPLGTCCLVQHLAEDYKLLQKSQKVACRESDTCREALQSIQNRRKRFLNKADCGVLA